METSLNSYEHFYGQLNPEQRVAVDTIDGPLLVLAGPGTGKTQLLSVRAASILNKTDVRPENILILKFGPFCDFYIRTFNCCIPG